MENRINALSFCELLHIFGSDGQKNKNVILEAEQAAGFGSASRFYLGSNFCSRYFIKYTEAALSGLADILRGDEISVTLCVPMFSERYLDTGKKLVRRLLAEYSDIIDEVTVNDFGMLDYITECEKIKVNIGRLLNKDTRDIRHDDYYNRTHVPTVATHKNSVFSGYEINSHELDLTNRFLDVSSVPGIPAIYAPFVFATVGNVCEYASDALPITKKFRANYDCGFACTKLSIDYENQFGNKYLKIGKAVFFDVLDYTVTSDKPYRLIYEPFAKFRPGEYRHE